MKEVAYKIDMQVRAYEIDMQGIVSHGVYIIMIIFYEIIS
jgi:acyl-CoA thioesterase FadM